MMNNLVQLDNEAAWLEGVKRHLSPNRDARPENVEIDLLVIHGISLPPGEFGGPYIDQLFTNCLDKNDHHYFAEIQDMKVSTHLFIDRHGQITQYVPFNLRAWHAGPSTFEGRENCNDFSIGIELEGCDDIPYTEDQYQTLAMLAKIFMKQWNSITSEHIVGHSQIAPGRKTDPGDIFDWEYFYSLIN